MGHVVTFDDYTHAARDGGEVTDLRADCTCGWFRYGFASRVVAAAGLAHETLENGGVSS